MTARGVFLSEMTNRGAIATRARRRGAPDLLYHYTSIHGLKGIMEDRAVFASAVQFLNDSGEFKYAMDIARSELWRLSESGPNRRVWRELRSELDTSFASDGAIAIVYVFSLSEMGNQLSQWRAYCPPEGGYAVCFNTRLLRKQLRAQGFRLVRCEYDPEVQRKKIRATLSSVLDPLPDLQKLARNRRKFLEITSQLREKVGTLAMTFKHPDFREESEWRAVRLDPNKELERSFHFAGPVAVPHFRLSLDDTSDVFDFPIQHITVGPGPHQEIASWGLDQFLEQEGVGNVTTSGTPLRSFK